MPDDQIDYFSDENLQGLVSNWEAEDIAAIQNTDNYKVSSYLAESLNTKPATEVIGGLQQMYDAGEITDPEIISKEAERIRKLADKDYGLSEYRHYIPPAPDYDPEDTEEDKLNKIKDWRNSVESYGRLTAKESNTYSDWLVKKDWIESQADRYEETLTREVTGKDTSYVGDKIYRFGEALVEHPLKALGADASAKWVRGAFKENPKYDGDAAAAIAMGLGQGVAQIGLSTAAFAGTTALTKNPALGASAAAAMSFASNASINYQDAYDEIYARTGDAEKAMRGGLENIPPAMFEAITDTMMAGKLGKLTKAMSKAQKIDEMVDITKGVQKTLYKTMREGALSEGFTEPLQDMWTKGVIKYNTGDESINVFDAGEFAETGIISAAVGGILGAGVGLAERGVDKLRQRELQPYEEDAIKIKEEMMANAPEGYSEDRVNVSVSPSGKVSVNIGDIANEFKSLSIYDRFRNPKKYEPQVIEEIAATPETVADVAEEVDTKTPEETQVEDLASLDSKDLKQIQLYVNRQSELARNQLDLEKIDEDLSNGIIPQEEHTAIKDTLQKNQVELNRKIKEHEARLESRKLSKYLTEVPTAETLKAAKKEAELINAQMLLERQKLEEINAAKQAKTEPVTKPTIEEITTTNPEIAKDNTALEAIKTSLQSDNPVATIKQQKQEIEQKRDELDKKCGVP